MKALQTIIEELTAKNHVEIEDVKRPTRKRFYYSIKREIAIEARRQGHTCADIGQALGGLYPSSITRMTKGAKAPDKIKEQQGGTE